MSKNQAGSQNPLRDNDAEAQRDPGRDLFLWAVVQNSRELAEIAWEQVMKKFHIFMWCVNMAMHLSVPVLVSVSAQCRDCMSAALAASKILKKMADEGSDADEAEEMKQLGNHYEKHATGTTNIMSGSTDFTMIFYNTFIFIVCVCVSQVCSLSAITAMRSGLESCWFVCHHFGERQHA